MDPNEMKDREKKLKKLNQLGKNLDLKMPLDNQAYNLNLVNQDGKLKVK